MAIEIIVKQTNELIPYANNARTHSDDQISKIAASIKEFGFTAPILIDSKNGVIAGHGRLLAAKKLKLDEIPTISLDHLTERQRKAYILADNRLALDASWDNEFLKIELEELKALDFDMSLTGFGELELEELSDIEVKLDLESHAHEEKYLLTVECVSEKEQDKLNKELQGRGYKSKVKNG